MSERARSAWKFWTAGLCAVAAGLSTVLLRDALNLEHAHKELMALSILVSAPWLDDAVCGRCAHRGTLEANS